MVMLGVTSRTAMATKFQAFCGHLGGVLTPYAQAPLSLPVDVELYKGFHAPLEFAWFQSSANAKEVTHGSSSQCC